MRLLPVEGHPRQAPATLWHTRGAPRGHPAPDPQSASRGDPACHLLLATSAAAVPQGWWRTLRGLSRPISMAPCAKTRTNGVNGILFSQDVSKCGRHKSLCLRSSVGPMRVGPSWSSYAIMCAFSPLAPRVHPLPLQMKSALCPSALHHLARRPGKARSGLDLFLYLSRKPSFCPILPWFCAYSSRYSVNFRTGRCCTSLLTCGTKNSIVSFECRCRL